MTRFTVLLALVLFMVAGTAFAADPPSSATGSFAWQDGKDLPRSWEFGAEVRWPICATCEHFSLGVPIRANYLGGADCQDVTYEVPNPDDPEGPPVSVTSEHCGSVTAWEAGISGTVYFTDTHNGFHLGAAALKTFGDVEQYIGELYAGFEQGVWKGQRTEGLFTARFAHLFTTGVGEDDIVDLEQNQASAGFGLRF